MVSDMSDREWTASPGRYLVIGFDRYDADDYRIGEFESLSAALAEAEKAAEEARTRAIPASFADVIRVVDDRGVTVRLFNA